MKGISVQGQATQEIRSAVIDEEEVCALGVVHSADGAAVHGEIWFGHDHRVALRILERTIGHS